MDVIVQCEAILFDMDGTLVDSTPVVERQWKRFAERHGLNYAQIMKVSHGRRNEETIREIAPHLARPEIFAEFDAEEIQDRADVVAVGGSADLLEKLGEHEWAVVTSASRALTRSRLQTVRLPVPHVLIGADDVAQGKPDPEGYLAAARRLGVERRLCVVFEDTVPGLMAARAAGMRGIGIATTFSHRELGLVGCLANFAGVRVERLKEGSLRLTLPCY
jgi:HAD superfamily hydrolase (TIGR01509 family)